MQHPFASELTRVLEKLRRPRTFAQLQRLLPDMHPVFLATSISELRSEGQITSWTEQRQERYFRARCAA